MEDGRPSQTALLMAVLRAHHYLTASEPRILDDHLAMPLAGLATPAEVSGFVERVLEYLGANGPEAARAQINDLTMALCARSRLVEDQLAASLDRGMRQLVVLGAGLDSLAWRRPDITQAMAIFEVDHPATQAWKRGQIMASGIGIPDNLRFVPFDFERQTLVEALAVGGVQADRVTFFSWLGVQPYLTDDAVMATLDAITRFPVGSELVLDLVTADGSRENDELTRRGLEWVASVGEPFKSAYAREAFTERLERRGFGRIEMLGFPEWFARHEERFDGRFSISPRPSILVSAQLVRGSH